MAARKSNVQRFTEAWNALSDAEKSTLFQVIKSEVAPAKVRKVSKKKVTAAAAEETAQ